MADLREEVVFNLVVESTAKPCKHAAACAKVGSGPKLMRQGIHVQHCPFFGRLVVVVFHDVCGLENDGKEEARDQLHEHPSHHDLEPMNAAQYHGQHQDVGEVCRFGEGQRGGQLSHGGAGRTDQVLFVVPTQLEPVFGHHPKEGHQRIESPRIDVLEAMKPVARLQRAEPHEGVHVDVFVEPVNVGERVVQDVVLDFPNGGISSHQIEHPAHPEVDPLFVAVRVVVGVVHHVQPDACEAEAHDDFSHPKHPSAAGHAPRDQRPGHEVQRNHQGGLEVQAPIAFAAQVVLFEIRVDACTQGLGEV